MNYTTEEKSLYSFDKVVEYSIMNGLTEINFVNEKMCSVPVELLVSEIKIEQKKLIICVLRDISFRKENEKKITLRQNITKLLFNAKNIYDVAPRILANICEVLEWDIACFWLQEKEKALVNPTFICMQNKTQKVEDFKENILLKKSYCKPLKRANDITSEEMYKHGLKYRICINVYNEDEILGFIELYSVAQKTVDQQLKQIFQDIGYEIGLFIEYRNSIQREFDLQKELADLARKAGMAQVATHVLHNVGNILNTIKISVSTMSNIYANSAYKKIPKLTQLIKENKDDLTSFITERGDAVVEYLSTISECVDSEQDMLQKESKNLLKNVEHIISIIDAQQSISKISGVKEIVSINKILTDIADMNVSLSDSLNIHVHKEYSQIPEMIVDKNKLLQILDNLVKNAIEALDENVDEKNLVLRTFINSDHLLQIEITDNGCGIDPQDLDKIFAFGYTTKKHGHGFGLHSSALLAKELKGNLSAHSAGINKGATFTLTIPFQK